ncbi:MAG: hypothetical protein M1822_001394 [Bathelium mastoideum]|nr:MAG: hypothetical protein M1822_001394 [Bathelium mastoideum]
MSSLLSSYLIDPVVRQARRFSSPAPSRDSPASELRSESVSHVRTAATTAPLANDTPLPALLADLLHESDLGETSDNDSTHSPQVWGRSVLAGVHGGESSHVAAIVESPRSSSPDVGYVRDEQLLSISSHGVPGRFQRRSLGNSVRPGQESMSTETGGHRSRRSTGRGLRRSMGSTVVSEESAEAHENAGNLSETLPADDGMRLLRQKIHKIREMVGTTEEKARWMHLLMTKDYNAYRARLVRPVSPSSVVTRDAPGTPATTNSDSLEEFRSRAAKSPPLSNAASDTDQDYGLSPEDTMPTYCPQPERLEYEDDEDEDQGPILGCEHYKRNVKIQCSDCNRWYTCRFCHDAAESHALNRQKTKNMFCMLCRTPQPAASQCRDCGELAAWYYCDICKLWDNDSTKRIYHCPDCGICRKGEGLGKDFQHCKRCNVCISIGFASNHRCIEGATDCDCPICGDYMFSSARSVVAMPCGHYMHSACHTRYMQTAYRCPLCSRAAVNMELQWRKLDHAIAAQPMPAQFARTRVRVHCNDCSAKSVAPYHWLGAKCALCESYNTNELRLFDADDELPAAVDDNDDEAATNVPVVAPPEGGATLPSLQDLTLASPPTTTSALASSPPTASSPDARVSSASPSPRRALPPLRELRSSRSYFLAAEDDTAAATGTQPGSLEALGAFSPYEMLRRVSRSLSPIRYYLDGLGEESGGWGFEREDEEDEGEEEEPWGVDTEDEDEEDSDMSMDEEEDELDDDDDDDDDEVLDLPGHR